MKLHEAGHDNREVARRQGAIAAAYFTPPVFVTGPV
jgi:hypothetical protein